METKYKVTIRELKAYKKTDVQYEGTDGKVYTSTYNVPEDIKYKIVSYETGEIGYSEKDIYEQEVETLDLLEVVKAVNKIK